MNREYLYESIGELVDALLERTEQKRPANRRRPWWLMAAAAVLVVAPVLPILPFSEQPVYAAICEAEYPRMAPNPNLDRPFLFVITSTTTHDWNTAEMPLFSGVARKLLPSELG